MLSTVSSNDAPVFEFWAGVNRGATTDKRQRATSTLRREKVFMINLIVPLEML